VNPAIDKTHDPSLRSWVDSANHNGAAFPIQNLPFGVFRREESGEASRVGVAIGDEILDLKSCAHGGLLDGLPCDLKEACAAPVLNPLMTLGNGAATALRSRLSEILRFGAAKPASPAEVVLHRDAIELLLPVAIGDYTDFYASVFHATRVGKMFRPDNPLLPNYKHIPIAYHGRASSVVVNGTAVRRPCGQRKPPDSEAPAFGPSRSLDYELEVGSLVGAGNELGRPVPLGEAEGHIFGLCLVNDGSARDLQAWEYQPLGPFLSKSFSTTVSPWVVTLAALAPFRSAVSTRPAGDPQPLPYLSTRKNAEHGAIDLTLEVFLCSERMRRQGMEPVRLSRGSFREMYWTVAQMLTHHTSNGCNLGPGDLLASGTVSGSRDGSAGCLLELTGRGSQPIPLPNGEERGFLADGDEVILRGYCEREGYCTVGFGECRGVVLPASSA